MRRDGDHLLEHVGKAKRSVLLCAPFIKVKVLRTLFDRITQGVKIQVVTRWLPAEVAAGVSDLEVFELIAARTGASLSLLDRLHAKLYLSDEAVLVGSANLTATALGWCEQPNLEILVDVPFNHEVIVRSLRNLSAAREATEAERDRVRAEAAKLVTVSMPSGQEPDEAGMGIWLPSLGDPLRLFAAYMPVHRDRLTAEVLGAADRDLRALEVPDGLNASSFNHFVAQAFISMPAIKPIVEAAATTDLSDSDAIMLLAGLTTENEMSHGAQWRVVRDWMAYFLKDAYEIAPQSFITRRRPVPR